ncbi:hypothetical protein AVEN_93328-1 [Araneus ventricosus]|uniref:Uncharacterized protein n=1 Tax=Araneus ventricosus TaxID=182803 RepID=A0A4Y2SBZ6_ARAVE|nr:hypothetical protein AVEN_232748-1 [Araneus ventricosus]GBN85808.1 hypothetical protein AVEN_93328-1 [Araneus ventricosus]
MHCYGALNLLQSKIPNARVKWLPCSRRHVSASPEANQLQQFKDVYGWSIEIVSLQVRTPCFIGKVLDIGQPLVSDEIVQRVRETFTP